MNLSFVNQYRRQVLASCDRRAPGWFVRLFPLERNPSLDDWYERSGLEQDHVLSAAYRLFWSTWLFVLMMTVPCVLFLQFPPNIPIIALLLLLPPLRVRSFLQVPARSLQKEELAMLAEAPVTIGAMSISINLRPVLESAMAYAGENSEGVLPRRLRERLWRTLTVRDGAAQGSLTDLALKLTEVNQGLRQALLLLVTACQEGSRHGVDRLLDRANRLVLEAVKEKVERFVSSLSVPTMVLFAFGILLPVMLFSLVPLLSLSSVVSGSTAIFDDRWTWLLMLVVFPLFTLLYSRSVVERNPLGKPCKLRMAIPKKRLVIALVTPVPVAVLLLLSGLDLLMVLAATLLLPTLMLLYWLRPWASAHKEQASWEEDLTLGLFQMGNTMLSGSSFEMALRQVGEMQTDRFRRFATDVLYRSRVERCPLRQILAGRSALASASPLLRQAFVAVAESAVLDVRGAGRAAINLAQYISDLREAERRMVERLRSMIDMMSYTAMFFAPIVLAITASLFSVLDVTSMDSMGRLDIIGLLYVVELCLVVSYFNQRLLGAADATPILHQFVTRAPVAVLTYILTFMASGQGLNGLF